ncbi:MAG: 4Fe-4S binding protein, partial [Acidobacteria bacterium]|nr:4Fe-4S binding protein [Acidobacteriota bacterium]
MNADFGLQFTPDGPPSELTWSHKLAIALLSLGALLILLLLMNRQDSLFGWLGLGLFVAGATFWFVPQMRTKPGIRNDYLMVSSLSRRGALGWALGLFLTGFYVVLYFWPQYLRGLIVWVDPLKVALSGSSALDGSVQGSQWFLYGFLYTLAVSIMGVRALIRYRHSRYQVIRTASVMFFQLGFAFLIPNILLKLNQPYFEWTNIWPLRYYELWPDSATYLAQTGWVGPVMLFWGIGSFLILTPILTYFFGKRWYCSWVCGCGGLAETLGDPFRQNSSKTERAWR